MTETRHHQLDRLLEWGALQQSLLRRLIWRDISLAERGLATELRELREAIGAATGWSESCASCAQDPALPHGDWPGGWCCGAETAELFNRPELHALALAGTRPWHLRPVLSGIGCLFRSHTGCTLPPRHRPNVCLGYLCWPLKRELAGRGALDRVEDLCERLMTGFEQLALLRFADEIRQWEKLRERGPVSSGR